VLDRLDDLLELAHIDFAPVYERVQRRDEIEPAQLLPEDRIITNGSGRYHAARRAEARHAV